MYPSDIKFTSEETKGKTCKRLATIWKMGMIKLLKPKFYPVTRRIFPPQYK